jgi:hypothetical protein
MHRQFLFFFLTFVHPSLFRTTTTSNNQLTNQLTNHQPTTNQPPQRPPFSFQEDRYFNEGGKRQTDEKKDNESNTMLQDMTMKQGQRATSSMSFHFACFGQYQGS